MLFSFGMYLLLSPGISDDMLDFAHKPMVSFVEHFGQLYGKDEIVFTVHQLIHLAEEYRQFGPLDNISGFPFENCLGQIKHLLRKPHQPLQQVVKRLFEIPRVRRPYPIIQYYITYTLMALFPHSSFLHNSIGRSPLISLLYQQRRGTIVLRWEMDMP